MKRNITHALRSFEKNIKQMKLADTYFDFLAIEFFTTRSLVNLKPSFIEFGVLQYSTKQTSHFSRPSYIIHKALLSKILK